MSKLKVLWIDDQPEKVALEREFVEKTIENYGFTPEIKITSKIDQTDLNNDSELIKKIKSREYDLLFIDYKLSHQVLGSQIIGRIRSEHNIYVDVIFYSSDKEELINAVIKSYNGSTLDYLDDVHILPLDDTDFNDKVEIIIKKIIGSWYNAQSIRGIILSKASKFELLTNELIQKYYSPCLATIKNSLKEKNRNILKTINDKWNSVEKKEDPINVILKDPINFNWSVKQAILQVILDERIIALSNWENLKSIFRLRNDFAHNVTKINSGNLILYKEKDKCVYDEIKIEEIRKNINDVETELLNLLHADNYAQEQADEMIEEIAATYGESDKL